MLRFMLLKGGIDEHWLKDIVILQITAELDFQITTVYKEKYNI